MNKNNWPVSQDNILGGSFILSAEYCNQKTLFLLVNRILFFGLKYELFYLKDLNDNLVSADKYQEYLNETFFVSSSEKKLEFDVFMPIEASFGGENIYKAYTKLAMYNHHGDIEYREIHNVSEIFNLIPSGMINHYKKNIDRGMPMDVHLEFSGNLKSPLVSFCIESNLHIWKPYYKNWQTEDFNRLIDNRELYLLNTSRLILFIKEISNLMKELGATRTSEPADFLNMPTLSEFVF